MTLLVDIAPYAPPVSPEVTGKEIYLRFQAEPDTLAIAVVDAADQPIGIIERNAFLVRMAAQYGYALWSGRPVSFWMKTDPVVADGATSVAEFCGRMLRERPSELMDGFVITCGGRYAGVGTALGLLQASAAAAASAADASQQALAAKGRFLATMSHEIRTPLNGVLAVAEILRRKARQPDLNPLIDTIVESGGSLLRLLNDALDLSRAEASGLELDEAPLRPESLVDEALNLWTAHAELKGVGLRARFSGPDDVWLLADGVRLRQVLNNLIGNALKFTQAGEVEVRLSVIPDGEYARLVGEVLDTGPGIPADKLTAIFQPFAQTEDGVRRGGAGLGLAVCQQIVERMDGRIRAENRPGGGAAFTFEAPFHALPAPALEEGAAPPEHLDRPLHVLVVDDNATNRLVAKTFCDLFGCTSEAVEDGAAAVAAAATGRFDLILMDIKMPGMDGVEATRRIRSGARAGSQVPILALTANADPADAAFYWSCGMNGVVEKPIKPERLLAAMNAVLHLDPIELEILGVA